MTHSSRHSHKGFTLIELLVVIAIVAVLSLLVVLVLNPAELLRQSRDTARLSDLSILKTALSLYLADTITPNLASSSLAYTACYLSTTSGNGTSTTKCGMFVGAGIVANASTTSVLYKNIDSTGWMPVNFSQISAGSPFSALPVDPTNNANYYYAYAASGSNVFEIDAVMESQRYRAGGSKSVVGTDGGDNANIYEVGTNMAL